MTDDSRPGSGESEEAAQSARAFNKAVDLLANRPHFTAELGQKLQRRGFADGDVTEALERLTSLGYLDDLAAAQGFAQHRAERQGWGPRRLRAELARRRVDEEIVSQVVAEAFREGEKPAARAAAERWSAKGGSDRDRLARYLDRRGFSKAVIVEILHEFVAQGGSPNEEF